MPSKNNKRAHNSDSDSSINSETSRNSSTKRRIEHQINRKSDKDMVNANDFSANFDIRLSNGRINGISVDTTIINGTLISGNVNMNPIVVLNRVETVDNAIKRKSLGMNLVNDSSRHTIDDTFENEERKQRQFSRLVAQRRSIVNSPNVVSTPRRSAVSTSMAMNATQLKEHYAHCIQLSANNKINTKNAFGLYLIDCMSELLQQTQDDGVVNFKLAGTALDAGAKIYSHRVDWVHAEAQKVASSLAMALDKKSTNQSDDNATNDDHENNEQHMSDAEDNRDNNGKPKRKKVTKKNVRTLAISPETLNVAKLETNLEIDPVFHHLSSAFDVGNVNSLLMANLKVNPNGMLMLDSNSSLVFDNTNAYHSTTQDIHKFYNNLDEISKCSSQICPRLSSFEFLNRENGLDLIQREEDPSFSNRKDSFTFDLEAEVEDVDDNDMGDGGDVFLGDDLMDDSGSEDGIGGHLPAAVARKSVVNTVQMGGVSDLVKLLSDKPNDYSYFNPKLLSSWAGPQHWKRCPFLQRKKPTDKDGDVAKARRQRKQYVECNFCEFVLDDECDQTGGNNLKLKIATLEKWQKHHIDLKLPSDHGFDPKDLTRSFNRPAFTFQCAKSNEDIIDPNINTSNDSFDGPMSPGMDRYDYDDEDVDINTGAFTDGLELGQSAPVSVCGPNIGDTFPFTGDNLVEQAYDINQIILPYAKFAKKMDVKKLKRAMWDLLTVDNSLSPQMSRIQTPLKQMNSSQNFSELYQTLPRKVTPVMATNLSAPIAFVTLLHLCNERNLTLSGREDLEDFTIEQHDVQKT